MTNIWIPCSLFLLVFHEKALLLVHLNDQFQKKIKENLKLFFRPKKTTKKSHRFLSPIPSSIKNFEKMNEVKRKTIYLDEEKCIEISFEVDCLR